MKEDMPLHDEYLPREQLLQLKALLDEQLEQLLSQGRSHVQEATEQRSVDADSIDFAVSESSRDEMLRMADRERRLLHKVRHALTRMGDGAYGVCEGCGSAIGFKRLLARPVATLCIDCKTEAEHIEGTR
jgi:DnaK suppressor protein